MSGGEGVVVSRHELRWVLEQAGADRWPYPLRRPAWDAETESETTRHRARAETSLRERGLLEPAPARLLLRAGRLVARWHVAVDLVRRDAHAPCAAVALADAADAVLLVSAQHEGAPVRIVPVPLDRLPEALLALRPRVPAGVGGPWVIAEGAVDAPAHGLPTTDRVASARAAAEDLIAQARAVLARATTASGAAAGDPTA